MVEETPIIARLVAERDVLAHACGEAEGLRRDLAALRQGKLAERPSCAAGSQQRQVPTLTHTSGSTAGPGLGSPARREVLCRANRLVTRERIAQPDVQHPQDAMRRCRVPGESVPVLRYGQ